jgi:sugar phosphate isomerase/epimerase
LKIENGKWKIINCKLKDGVDAAKADVPSLFFNLQLIIFHFQFSISSSEGALMPRPVILFTGQWTDLPLEELAQKASEWGYQGLELCCWGDHFEVQRALSEDDYCRKKLDLLARYDLAVPVVSNHRVGQAVCDPIDGRHQGILPDYVWGDGSPEGVRQRAAEEMTATLRALQKLGVAVLSGFTGSPLWSYVAGYPAPTPGVVAAGLETFARQWHPILDVCRDCGIQYAAEVHPGQVAFDLYSAEMALDALGGREEFGFTFDPSHLHWQGVDPVEFLRRFPDRIYHVHVKDAALALNGRTGILGSYLPYGDPRRGWDFRSPGHGGIDWEAVVRALHDIGYDGALSVEWKDAGMDRDWGAEDACRFVKRLDFEPARSGAARAFREA